MNRSQYLSITSVLVFAFVFFKIYQHNAIVKLVYERQRLEKKKREIIKKHNELFVKLYSMKTQGGVREVAKEKLALRELRPSQVITVT